MSALGSKAPSRADQRTSALTSMADISRVSTRPRKTIRHARVVWSHIEGNRHRLHKHVGHLAGRADAGQWHRRSPSRKKRCAHGYQKGRPLRTDESTHHPVEEHLEATRRTSRVRRLYFGDIQPPLIT